MSSEFQKWCQEQMRELLGSEDTTLTEFLMTVESADEIQSYVSEYVGGGDASVKFVHEFLRRRTFERAAKPVVASESNAAASAAAAAGASSSSSAKKRSRRGKGNKADPASLGFGVESQNGHR